MGYKKPKETTRWHLENAPLPNHGESYTVISHGEVIENSPWQLGKIQTSAETTFSVWFPTFSVWFPSERG